MLLKHWRLKLRLQILASFLGFTISAPNNRIHKSQQYAAGVMPYHPVYSGYGDKRSYCLLLNPLKKIGKWSAKKTWAEGVKQRNFTGTIFNLCFNIHSLKYNYHVDDFVLILNILQLPDKIKFILLYNLRIQSW